MKYLKYSLCFCNMFIFVAEYFREPGYRRPHGKVTFKEWFKFLFSHSEARFRKSLDFKFFCHSFFLRQQLLERGRLMLRRSPLVRGINAEELRALIINPEFRRQIDVWRGRVEGFYNAK